MTKSEIYSRLKSAQTGGAASAATCNTAAYVAGISKQELINITKSKMFSGANQVRLIINKEVRNPGERNNFWEKGVQLLKSLQIPQQRTNWNDREDADLTGVQILSVSTNILPNNLTLSTVDGEDPTKSDVEKILREIAPKGKEIDEEVLKRRIEFAFALENRTLKLGWWERTKKNLVEWSKKGRWNGES